MMCISANDSGEIYSVDLFLIVLDLQADRIVEFMTHFNFL